MKRFTVLITLILASSSVLSASEPSSGTLIILSGTLGWVLLSSFFVLYKSSKSPRQSQKDCQEAA